MAFGHVFSVGAAGSLFVLALVYGNAFPLVEAFDHVIGDAHIHLLAGIGVRHAVQGVVDMHMVVDAHFRLLPFPDGVGLRWQRLHGGPVKLFKLGAPRTGLLLEGPVVKATEQWHH